MTRELRHENGVVIRPKGVSWYCVPAHGWVEVAADAPFGLEDLVADHFAGGNDVPGVRALNDAEARDADRAMSSSMSRRTTTRAHAF